MERFVTQIMLAYLGIACQSSADSVRLLIAAQVVHRANFARGRTACKLTCAVQSKPVERLVLREMHANREYVPEDSVAYAQQTLIVNPDTSAMTTFQLNLSRSVVPPPEPRSGGIATSIKVHRLPGV